MPPQPSTVKTSPLGQLGEAAGDALQGFIIVDSLIEQKKARNAKTIESGLQAFRSGNVDLALSIFQNAGKQGRSITEHLLAGPEGSDAPLDDVSGLAVNEILNIRQGRELAIEELIARGPTEPVGAPLLPGQQGPTKPRPSTSAQRQLQTPAGREDAALQPFIAGPTSPRVKLLKSVGASADDQLARARATAKEGREVEQEQRAVRAEIFSQSLAKFQERRAQSQAALSLQQEKRLTTAANNNVRIAIFDRRATQALNQLKLMKERVDEQGAFFDQIASDADANKKLNNSQVSANVKPTAFSTASSVRAELNRIAFVRQLPVTQAGQRLDPAVAAEFPLARPSSEVDKSLAQGSLTPNLERAVAAEFPQNAQKATRAFNKTIEAVRANEASLKAQGNKQALGQIAAVLSAVKGRPSELRDEEITRVLELLSAATGLPIGQVAPESSSFQGFKDFLVRGTVRGGLSLNAGQAIAKFVELFAGPAPLTQALLGGATETPRVPQAPAPRQVEDDAAEFLDF